MVLVHKLKQMEALDIEQFRDASDDEEAPLHARAVSEPRNNGNDDSTVVRKKRVPSPPRRPVTRSQTSSRPSRRTRDDNVDKELTTSKPLIANMESPVPEEIPSRASSVESEIVLHTDQSTTLPYPSSAQYTFLGASPTMFDRRGPRTRATLPIPVPNLTKKSRGRRVPTKPAAEKDGTQKASRLYICKVEHCGKCFNRGEHLKRHIRSIHTHEKPFQCSHPTCDKFFNRHDNLLQHLKVHKDLVAVQNQDDSKQLPTPTDTPRPVPDMSPSYSSFFHTPPLYTTNIAVSSLRTEISPSSPEPLLRTIHDTPGRSHYRRAGYNDDPFPNRNTPYNPPQLLHRSTADQQA